ncbi:MAG: TlpA disulfide reductase family protein [Chitinophagaceae bacterium]
MNKIRIAIVMLVACMGLQAVAQQPGSISVQVRIGNAKSNDTMWIAVWDHTLSARTFSQLPSRIYPAAGRNGVFQLRADSVQGLVYISVMKDHAKGGTRFVPMMSDLLAEPGDQVSISMDSLVPIIYNFPELGDQIMGYRKVNIAFQGKGAAKYEFQDNIQKQTEEWMVQHRLTDWSPPAKYDSAYYTKLPKLAKEAYIFSFERFKFQLEQLQRYKAKMSPQAWQILKANLAGAAESGQISSFISYRGIFRRDTTVTAAFRTRLADTLQAVYNARKRADIQGVSKDLLPYAVDYVGFVSDYAYYVQANQYETLKSHEQGLLRDKAITDFILKHMFHMKRSEEVLADATAFVDDPYYSAIVTGIYNRQRVGSEGFNFELPDTKGRMVRLSDFKGKIVFIDLWYTGCGACQGFYKYQLSRVEEHYVNNPDVVFITISIDANLDRWLKSVNEGIYSSPNSPNVVNLYTNGEGSNHPLIKAYNVMGYPHPFMIDRNGKIYQIDSLQTSAENLIPIIDKAIAKKS